MTKEEKVLNEIIRQITHDEKIAGDTIISRDYELSPKYMAKVFKTLSDNGIVKKKYSTNVYYLTEDCYSNAKCLYCSIISDNLSKVVTLASAADIATDILIEMLNAKDKYKTETGMNSL